MEELLKSLNGLEMFFLICALVGGLFFFFRFLMQLIGFDHDDAGLDGDMGDHGHLDSDVGFKILTMQGMTAFFMMFGLVGLALYRQTGVGAFLSVGGASVAGMGTVWVIGRLFSSMGKLQSSGTLDTVSVIGAEGTVYLTIPPGQRGQVHVTYRNRRREFEAVAQNEEEEIGTGERIRVVWVNGNVLVVEKI